MRMMIITIMSRLCRRRWLQSERSIKKINGEPARDDRKQNERVVNFSAPLFQGAVPPEKEKAEPDVTENTAAIEKADLDDIDFEKKLEESLKDL